MEEKEFKLVVAANIIKYRKMKKITQLELAETLHYSDKAVSKWERGESLPDVIVLKELADFFGVTLDTLITDNKEKHYKIGMFSIKRRILIPVLSVVMVWVLATLTFAFFNWLRTPFFVTNGNGDYSYAIVFFYAIPISMILLLIFSLLWWTNITTGIFASGLIWTVALSIHFSLSEVNNIWMIYLVGVPCQIAAVLWFFIKPQRNKLGTIKKRKNTNTEGADD